MSDADYWCEVILSASGKDFPLNGYQAKSPRLAVRWMRDQALRVADLMDPDLSTPWLFTPGARFSPLREVPADRPDAPQDLRNWHSDYNGQAVAMETLARGGLVRFSVDDGTTAIAFSARQLIVRFLDDWRLREVAYAAA
ncbi:hypothetical protein [Streptomyces sp. ISL-100]|uniref:hypothetical protein n=1 Tax=Streptomyces sp. ISL-100 TaxID=2819173 RepID=UPI001BECA8F2|nr:hypothetical protein [Streptomyces sp. ISL-100]MBT2401288.1 hypothetical protein [Streptomyces sp. ISL-100]